jgi:ACS family D-galactonate transporter-like MFS transporter
VTIPQASPLHNQTEPGRALARFGPTLVLLFIAILINYVDRGNLSVAASLVQQEWHISSSSLGVLFSAFFWTYTAMQFFSGWLTDKLGATLVMGLGFLVWSLATAISGLVPSIALLFLMRLMLGVGESVMFPASSKILAEHLPEEARGFANGVICAGQKCGPAVGTLAGGMLMARYGWRWTFLWVGLVSLLWVPAWRRWGARSARTCRDDARRCPSTVDILRQRSFWGVSFAAFCGAYEIYFVVIWLPLYLMKEIHLSMRAMARTAGGFFLIEAASALITGWVADSLIRGGRSPSVVRKSMMALGTIIAAAGLLSCALGGAHAYLWGLAITAVGGGLFNSGIFTFGQTLAGPLAAGRWVGLQNGLTNFSGIFGPALTGFLLDRTGGFAVPLMVAAVMTLISGWAWVFLTGPLQQVEWTQLAAAAPVDTISPI